MREQSGKHTLIVGISGGSASGKSTFIHMLSEKIKLSDPAINMRTISTDHYFHRDFSQIPTYFSPAFQTELPDFNHPDALDIPQLIKDLKALLSDENSPDLILLEGHLLFHYPDLRDMLDLRIFIDLDGETRALRRMVRNLEHPGDPIPDHSAQSIANYYLESARSGYQRFIAPTKQYADLILNGDGDFQRTAPMVSVMIQAMI